MLATAPLFACMQGRASADPTDPEIIALERQLAELGPLPRRLQMSQVEAAKVQAAAEEAVRQGQVGGQYCLVHGLGCRGGCQLRLQAFVSATQPSLDPCCRLPTR